MSREFHQVTAPTTYHILATLTKTYLDSSIAENIVPPRFSGLYVVDLCFSATKTIVGHEKAKRE
jgi:hypothetical protein